MSFMAKHKYKIDFNFSFDPSAEETVYPSLAWVQKLSSNENRYILGRLNDYSLSKDFSDYSREIVFMNILNSEDKRYTKINSKNTVQNLEIHGESKILNILRNFRASSERIKLSPITDKITKEVQMRFSKAKEQILLKQDELFAEFLISKKAEQIKTEELDEIGKGIKLSKLFLLESLYTERVMNIFLETDSISAFRHCFEEHIDKDVFILFDELRKLSKLKENINIKHQLGLFSFNGFMMMCLYSRPAYTYVEKMYENIDCSRIFNLNFKNSKFEVENDVEEFLELMNTYFYSSSREIETIKEIYNQKNSRL
jgi:hypothetical protein